VAITSVGYDGSVFENQWARLASFFSQDVPVVGDTSHFRVAALGSGTRQVTVQPGDCYGDGVLDTLDSVATVTLAAISSGTRWDTIVLRRDWRTTDTAGVSSLVALTGGAAKVLSSQVKSTPGSISDQPLALVQLTAGQTVPTAVLDLRKPFVRHVYNYSWDAADTATTTGNDTNGIITTGRYTWEGDASGAGLAFTVPPSVDELTIRLEAEAWLTNIGSAVATSAARMGVVINGAANRDPSYRDATCSGGTSPQLSAREFRVSVKPGEPITIGSRFNCTSPTVGAKATFRFCRITARPSSPAPR
jgi:hypothetical protein